MRVPLNSSIPLFCKNREDKKSQAPIFFYYLLLTILCGYQFFGLMRNLQYMNKCVTCTHVFDFCVQLVNCQSGQLCILEKVLFQKLLYEKTQCFHSACFQVIKHNIADFTILFFCCCFVLKRYFISFFVYLYLNCYEISLL